MSQSVEPAIANAIRNEFLGRHLDSYNILKVAELLASFDSAQYYLDHMSSCYISSSDLDLLTHAVRWQNRPANDGLVLEFGVASGRTINHLASLVTNTTIFGFDWFQGLPEIWRAGFPQGAFAGSVPQVRENVELVQGLFEESLPKFLDTHPGQVGLLHVDCDIYSSTKTIFRYIADRIMAGTIIVFDEYMNYTGWRLHEHKAFQEFVADHRRSYEYLGLVPHHQQVCVRITS